jgi:hypothetical protein
VSTHEAPTEGLSELCDDQPYIERADQRGIVGRAKVSDVEEDFQEVRRTKSRRCGRFKEGLLTFIREIAGRPSESQTNVPAKFEDYILRW